MVGRSAGPVSQPPEPDAAAPNVVARIAQWADDHLRLVQNISTGMAVAGIILFVRSVRLTSKFTRSSDIPVEFIRKNVKLRGRLHRITEDGLEIEHVPITLPLIPSWRMFSVETHIGTFPSLRQNTWDEELARREAYFEESQGLLLVRLAGVALEEPGRLWLQEELRPSQLLWFQLLGREDTTLFCFLFVNKGGYFSVNLNEEILRRGLGKTVLVKGLNYDTNTYWKIHRRLLKAELTALRKGEGIWKEEYQKESYLEKFKDSWRELWKTDRYLETPGADFNLRKDSYYDKFRRTYETWKDSVNNHSLVLKLRELLSRLHLRRKG